MVFQFLLFVIAVLLVSIFWELTKINKHLRTLLTQRKTDHDWAKKDDVRIGSIGAMAIL
jgi:hypothetical protein